MTVARLIAIALALATVAVMRLGWSHLGLLRGTVLWDLRHVVFAAGVFLLLSLAQWLTGRLERLFGGRAAP